MESSASSSSRAGLARAVAMMLPKLLFPSVELEMFMLVFQKIIIFSVGGANKGRKRGSVGQFCPSTVAFVNLAQDFLNRLFLHSESAEDFC